MQQATGYQAFIPADLPPDPPIAFDRDLICALSEADRALGSLEAVSTLVPDPDLFVAMYVRQEAVLSSQIEGTQSTLEDVLQFEAEVRQARQPKDVTEVFNYVRAMNYGLNRLKELPLSLRLIREIHAQLLEGTRGSERELGEFRRSQNWIGPAGCLLSTATFVPPPPHEMKQALDNFEKFLHENENLPVLIHCGLAHAQFETIHPFLDGNGRVGRLLIAFLLCQRHVLSRPLLYLSHYFKAHRAEYYDRLMATRLDGDWEGWLRFFLRGVATVSHEAVATARAIIDLRERHQALIRERFGSRAGHAMEILKGLYQTPLISVRNAERALKCSYATANATLRRMQDEGLIEEITGGHRNRWFRYSPYVRIFEKQSAEGVSSEVGG